MQLINSRQIFIFLYRIILYSSNVKKRKIFFLKKNANIKTLNVKLDLLLT